MGEITENTGADLVIPTRADLAVMMRSTDGLDPIISRIEAEARAHAPDLTTVKGRKAIASLAYKVSQSKAALDEAGKALNEDARKQIAMVDAERRKARERLDALRDEVRKPLTDWENAENERIERHKARITAIENAAPEEDTSEAHRMLIARIEAMMIDDSWQEFLPIAAKAKDAALARLRDGLARAITREEQEAELARLRAEAAAREEVDRLRRDAEEAEAARIAAEKAEADRLAQIEREKQEAAERAAKAAEERAKEEAECAAREATEREAELKRAAEEQAAQHQRELQEAKRREEAAAKAERDRIARENAAAEAARQKRAADETHRAKIKADIAEALRTMSGRATPEAIADALMGGLIPHCEVRL